jgi:polyisoprenoid-binding protein YceI
MSIAAGTYTLGPGQAALTVKTGKTGAAAKAGHNLVLEVTKWEATVVVGDDATPASIALAADSRSLEVLEGSGGMQALGDEEKASIKQSIDDDVLKGTAIEFRSTAITPGADAGRRHVEGELELGGARRPIAFDLAIGDGGAISGSATVTQSDWGIKPFSILFGTLKVADDVEVVVSAALRPG